MIPFNFKAPMKKKPRHPLHLSPVRFLAAVAAIILIFTCTDNVWSEDLGQPVARVNGVGIYQSDISCAIEISLVRDLTSKPRKIKNPDFESAMAVNEKELHKLIDIELLYQESLKHRFRGLIEESTQRYELEVKRLGGKDRLMSTLQCNNMSPEQFQKTIFRNLSIKRLLDEVVYSRIHVTEDTIRKHYELNKDSFRKPESIRIRQILIKVRSGPGDDAWNHAEDRAHTIYQDASAGADFVRLARRYSDDPASASVGGDLGSIQKGNMQGVLDTRIFSLKVGTVTKPIRSHQGFHIIKVVSTTPPATRSLEEMKAHITTRIRRERAREMISQLIRDLKDRAEIEIFKRSNQ
jgi:hypothetical protein